MSRRQRASSPHPERTRSEAHLRWIRQQPCSVPGCYRQAQAHHLTIAQPKAGALTAGDQWAVPLCADHHLAGFPDSVHTAGDERAWWARHGIDPIALAQMLWAERLTGGLPI